MGLGRHQDPGPMMPSSSTFNAALPGLFSEVPASTDGLARDDFTGASFCLASPADRSVGVDAPPLRLAKYPL